MQVAVGRTVPRGFLPVYSVDTEEEAHSLVVLTCSRDSQGNYWNRGLAEARMTPANTIAEMDAQLASLDVFSDQIDKMHELLKSKGHCKCKQKKPTNSR